MNKYYLILLIATFLTAFSQIMLKISTKKKYEKRIFEYLNPWVMGSYIILAGTLVATSYTLRHITIVENQAINALSYFFVLVMDKLILKEEITKKMIIGNLIIFAGVMLVVG